LHKLRLRKHGNLVGGVEFVVHEAGDDAGFPDGLIAQENELVFGERGHRRHFRESLSSSLSETQADLNLPNSLLFDPKKRNQMKDYQI